MQVLAGRVLQLRVHKHKELTLLLSSVRKVLKSVLLSFKQASTTNFFSKSVLESTLRMARCRNIKKHNETLSIIIGDTMLFVSFVERLSSGSSKCI